MLGAGFDAHVVAGLNPFLKRRLGKGAFVAETLRQLAVFPFPRYEAIIDGAAHRAASVVVAKARYYGGAYCCAPAAGLSDPYFHVCLFERPGPLAAARYAHALVRGRLAAQPGYRIVTGSRVRIVGPAGDPVQGDGDIVAALPVDIDMAPNGLNLVMPPSGGSDPRHHHAFDAQGRGVDAVAERKVAGRGEV